VFPGPGAVSVRDMMRCLRDVAGSRSPGSCSQPCRKRLKAEAPGASPLQRVVFIDSTWNQTNKISSDERLQGNHGGLRWASEGLVPHNAVRLSLCLCPQVCSAWS